VSRHDKYAVAKGEPDHSRAKRPCLQGGLLQTRIGRQWKLINELHSDTLRVSDSYATRKRKPCGV